MSIVLERRPTPDGEGEACISAELEREGEYAPRLILFTRLYRRGDDGELTIHRAWSLTLGDEGIAQLRQLLEGM